MRLIFLLSLTIFLFANCADSPERPAPVMTQSQHDAVNAESAALQAQKAAQAAAASVASPSVLHYYCSTHPTKGGDAQGACPDCGQALVHNQAFHNTPATPGAATPGAITPNPVPAAATNAAGVYHYTCSNGCAGGAAAQANCAVCGNPLAHNQAYHN
ncbi:heavy metal-binding domain-containing protein [Portibacter lacus]|uniref:Heavy metal binding domain-containing protein n=1 Tax=Portibacter lacus TaxID=1099794 RepID=A0AA37SMI2_9BACT|nr:heavy metal-binding domain-containing protein [Portibacter lacus]GLR15516.1 hypothetical protein GCM10007940_01310 [Portibacter lacus]